MPRITEPEREDLSPDQAAIYDEIVRVRGSIAGPFRVWLHSPELARRASHLGEFLRYKTNLDPRLSELAILITARFWNCETIWQIHAPLAREAGLPPSTLDALHSSTLPDCAEPDERAVAAFCTELHQHRTVSNPVYASLVAAVGEQASIELTAICGYYTMVAMTLNVFTEPRS